MEARTRVVVTAIAVLAVAMVAWLLLDPATPAVPTPEPSVIATAPSTASPVVPATTDATSSTKAAAAATGDTADAAARVAAPIADPKLATLRGRCVDENGAPLAGCKVSLNGWMGNSERMDDWLQKHGAEPQWKAPPAITTANDGLFELCFWPPPPFQFTVDVRQDGRGTMGGRWSGIAEGSTKDVGDVRMSPGVRVSGRVVDEQGKPREKDYVTLQRDRTARSREGIEPIWGEQTVSKADGSFILRNWLPPGEYTISTQGSELQSPKTVQLIAERRDEVLALVVRVPTPGEMISGRVVDDAGAPVRGIEIEDRSAYGRSSARSGRDGTFKLEQRGAGGAKTASLVLSSQEYEVDEAPREVAWGTQDVEFRVRKAAALTLRITDEQGAPVDSYLVRLIPRNRSRWSSSDSEPRAKGKHEDGTVVIAGLTKGDWMLMVEFAAASGFCALQLDFTQDAGHKRFDLRALQAQRRTLRVVGPDGPIAGTTVQLCDLFGTPLTDGRMVMQRDHWLMNSGNRNALVLWEGTTDGDGRVVMAGPGDRDLGVCVPGPGHLPVRLAPVSLGVAEELVVTVGRSTTRGRSRGCCWRWGCRRQCRSRRGAVRRRREAGSSTSTRVPRSSGGNGAVTSGRSWRGSGASGGRATGRNEPQAGSCDRLDWDVRGRQDERGGFQVVWDRSLNFLSPRLMPRPLLMSTREVSGCRMTRILAPAT
jgi:protocatechuate 3,4-dioxygenase beta subunit